MQVITVVCGQTVLRTNYDSECRNGNSKEKGARCDLLYAIGIQIYDEK